MRGRKDWSPGALAFPWNLSRHAWWGAMSEFKRDMGSDAFVEWLTVEIRPWSKRRAVIEELAWNDHNSEFSLDFANIIRTRHFDDGELVSAAVVAESLDNQML